MKITQFITQREAAGAQNRAVKMMGELHKRGYDVNTVFLFRKRQAFDVSPHLHDLWPRRPTAFELPFLLVKLWRHLRAERPDIVMPYTHWGNVIVGAIARFAGARHVLANQTQVPSREPRLARFIDGIWGAVGIYQFNICNSATTEREMRKRISQSYATRLRRVTLGVEIEKSSLSKQEIRMKYGLPNTTLLMHVGRLSIQKNHDTLLRALVSVPNTQLVCIGDGERREVLRQLGASLGVCSRVHWLGERSPLAVAELLQAGDIFVFPSRWEGFGLAPVEAACANLPLVVSDIPIFHEVMRIEIGPRAGQIAAAIVDPESPKKLARELNEILSSPEKLGDLRIRAQYLSRQYSLARMTDDYEKVFSEALGNERQLANA